MCSTSEGAIKECIRDANDPTFCTFNHVLEVSQLYKLKRELISEADNITRIKFNDSQMYHIPKELTQTYINLEDLDASNCYISRFDGMDFTNVTMIKRLNMSFNAIHVLPKALTKNFNYLQVLDLSNNFLDIIDKESFFKNSELLYLNMSNNRLKTIGSTFLDAVKNVRILNLDRNRISNLCYDPLDIYDFKEFYLNDNELSSFNSNVFISLVKLDISRNALKGTMDFRNNSDLTELNIHGNSPEMLIVNLKLETLDASDSNERSFRIDIGNESLLKHLRLSNLDILNYEIIFKEIENMKNLESLDLSHNNLEYFNFVMLPKRLKNLNLERCSLKSLFSIDQVESFVPNLETINIVDNLFSCTDLQTILNKMKSLNVNVTGLTGENETEFFAKNCITRTDYLESKECTHEVAILWIILFFSICINATAFAIIYYHKLLSKKNSSQIILNDFE